MASSSACKSNRTSPKSGSHYKRNSTPKHDWIPDRDFYYELHTFQVDSVRFRIPTYHLSQSPFFQKLFYVAALNGPVETFCDVDDLEGVSATEFRDFLCVLFALCSVQFEDLRSAAIARVADIEDCVVRLAATRAYSAHQLLPKALEDMLERDASLTVEEYGTLGLELAAGVVRYREAVYPRSGEVVPKNKRESLIEKIFGDAFAGDWREGSSLGPETEY